MVKMCKSEFFFLSMKLLKGHPQLFSFSYSEKEKRNKNKVTTGIYL